MIQTVKKEGNLVEVDVDGAIRHEDYERLIPEFEEVIQREGSLRCLVDVKDIGKIEPEAILDELKFDLKHAGQIDRCAVVTKSDWMKRMSQVWGGLMPHAKVKCFTPDHRADAETWVRSN